MVDGHGAWVRDLEGDRTSKGTGEKRRERSSFADLNVCEIELSVGRGGTVQRSARWGLG